MGNKQKSIQEEVMGNKKKSIQEEVMGNKQKGIQEQVKPVQAPLPYWVAESPDLLLSRMIQIVRYQKPKKLQTLLVGIDSVERRANIKVIDYLNFGND